MKLIVNRADPSPVQVLKYGYERQALMRGVRKQTGIPQEKYMSNNCICRKTDDTGK